MIKNNKSGKKAPNFISRGVFDNTNRDVIKDLAVIVRDSLKEFPLNVYARRSYISCQ